MRDNNEDLKVVNDADETLPKTGSIAVGADQTGGEEYSLNDDRRVKVLSPGAMVAKRFFRNRVAVVGLAILAFMFLFSFLGGVVSPYRQDQLFYKTSLLKKEYAGAVLNEDVRFLAAPDQKFDSIIQAQVVLALTTNRDVVTFHDVNYHVEKQGEGLYAVTLDDGTLIGLAFEDIVTPSVAGQTLNFDFVYQALLAYSNEKDTFISDSIEYTVSEGGLVESAQGEVAFISKYVINAISPDVFLTREFQEELVVALESGDDVFEFTDTDGVTSEYYIEYKAAVKNWVIRQETPTRMYDTYSYPNKTHWLGTDRNGMDMLTRLMYGGRVSLVIGFIVELISLIIGVIMGGLAGYFGGWVDNLIMRIVDIFYCIPSLPLIIILGAAMDAMSVDPKIRMLYLMLILGFLGWAGMARLVRGQILSLREQEFMVATESSGIRVSRRIFRHLVPNVIPQLIVSCTMGIGSTILIEATLSFLGLGVKFPFASWGNIINDVNDTFVLQNYWFIWIPAGILILLTVLAFNLVGDGLRDAFDPKMKR